MLKKLTIAVVLDKNNELNINWNVEMPTFPGWFYRVARFFVSKTAGGMLKVLRDFVSSVRDDVEILFST